MSNASMTTKYIKLQLSGEDDAVNATIALLHHLNFINGSVWSNAVRKRGDRACVRVASRAIAVPAAPPEAESEL